MLLQKQKYIFKKLQAHTSPVNGLVMLQTRESSLPVILKFGTLYLLFNLWTDSGTITKSIGFGIAFSAPLACFLNGDGEIKYQKLLFATQNCFIDQNILECNILTEYSTMNSHDFSRSLANKPRFMSTLMKY